ncbi:MAG: 16S rRNA (uracil(1498)-N(3))-methyltransferase [Alphaproteobacteria bacterium]|nr:16S rRNA (uracil(1498)-N(3))-methyltransferase [Alphaproteobacteria bacterium]
MTIHRIASITPLQKGIILALDESQAHYVTSVLRLKTNDTLRLFHADSGEYEGVIHAVYKKGCELRIGEQTRSPKRSPDFWCCFAPVKGGRTETIIEKATELGARVIQPVLTKRCVVDKVNLERFEIIAREAAEQCERLDIPEIRPLIPFEKLLASWPNERLLFYGDESGNSESITKTLENRTPQIASLAGPEGGFTPEEFAQLSHVAFARGVSLGPRILRSDTANITLCALIMQQFGDWNERPRFQPNA